MYENIRGDLELGSVPQADKPPKVPIVGRKPLVLERYDGTVPLETFLAKFQNCAGYNKWTTDENGVFLPDSLTGPASQILWEIAEDVDYTEIIRLLRPVLVPQINKNDFGQN